MIIDDNDDAACLSRQVECVLLSQVVDVHLAEAAWLSIIFIFDRRLSSSLLFIIFIFDCSLSLLSKSPLSGGLCPPCKENLTISRWAAVSFIILIV